MRAVLTLAAAAVLLALAAPAVATDPCRNRVCLRKDEFQAQQCTMCEKAYKVSNAGVDDPCCKTFACKPDPENPCCGRTCPTEAEELATCNLFEERSEIANMLRPEYGTRFLSLERPAKPDKGKCCNKYRCEIDHIALCRNLTADAPCPTEADCGVCGTAQIISFADPANGRCCPEFQCITNQECLCANRTNTNCPVPTCDPLEDIVEIEPANAAANNCCPRYACVANNTRICEARNAADNYTGPACPACELPIVLREARPERLRCREEFVCVADPRDRCCGFNSSTCPAPPTCGDFEFLNQTREINIYTGQCCEEFRCFKNFTAVCQNIPCPYADAAAYMADNCPNPAGRNWYFAEVKREADIEAGRCCPTYTCRETTEKKIYDLEQQQSGRRRRRRS